MSKKGTSTFVLQRASAVILAPLAIWLLLNIVALVTADMDTARAWLQNPINGLLFGAFLAIGAFHMRTGMAEIIVDYIHSWAKDVLLFINWLAAISVIIGVSWAVLTLSFAG